MILNAFFMFCTGIMITLFGIFNIPHFPPELLASLRSFLNLIANNLSLIGLIFRPSTFTSFCAIAIVLVNFEHIYGFTVWVYRKIFNRL